MDSKTLDLLMRQEPFLSSKQMAKFMGYKSDDALRKQRSKKYSLFPYIKLKGRIFYRLSDTLEEVKKNLIKPT
jgi:hypothetical protein